MPLLYIGGPKLTHRTDAVDRFSNSLSVSHGPQRFVIHKLFTIKFLVHKLWTPLWTIMISGYHRLVSAIFDPLYSMVRDLLLGNRI